MSQIALNIGGSGGGGGSGITSVVTDSGTVTPVSNTINIIGGTNVTTSGAGDTLTIDATGGGGVSTLTTNSGTATESAGNINVLGLGETITSASGATVSILSPRTAEYVVDPTLNNGTHQTIQAAITAASSGDTIFIRPGTYTENLTLKAGVNLAAYSCDALTPNVVIAGNATATFTGACTLTGIRLRTNAANFLTVSGVGNTVVNLINCYS